ncbi:MAG: hypothetical protein ACPGUD_07810 [Parashewanella sp.]
MKSSLLLLSCLLVTSHHAFSSESVAAFPCLTNAQIQGDGTIDSPYRLQNNTLFCNLSLRPNATLHFRYQLTKKADGLFKLTYNLQSSASFNGELVLKNSSHNDTCVGYPIHETLGGKQVISQYCTLGNMQAGEWDFTLSTSESQQITGAAVIATMVTYPNVNPFNQRLDEKVNSQPQ